MRPWLRRALVVVIAAVAALPVAIPATWLLQPLWRWVETALGVESVGHSGPAGWCHDVTWLVTTTTFVGPWRTLRAPPIEPDRGAGFS